MSSQSQHGDAPVPAQVSEKIPVKTRSRTNPGLLPIRVTTFRAVLPSTVFWDRICRAEDS